VKVPRYLKGSPLSKLLTETDQELLTGSPDKFMSSLTITLSDLIVDS
jgi:hypothetical protein